VIGAVGGDRYPEPAADHQIQAIAGIALAEDDLPGGHGDRFQLPGQLKAGSLVQCREERDVGQECVQFRIAHRLQAGAY